VKAHHGAETLVQITAPHFCAGIVVEGVVRDAAPIVKYMRGWTLDKVTSYCAQRHWQVQACK
jgi:hypothetical protein